LWADLDGDPGHLTSVRGTGDAVVLPSAFDVTGFATATVAAACLAVAELAAARAGTAVPAVAVDRRRAAASFRAEALLSAEGWELPPPWDPVAGDYEAADGWIRLHTNYDGHRRAALDVLGVGPDRDAVAAAVARRPADALEEAVVDAGGAAAVLRSHDAWRAHPAGAATAGERPVVLGPPLPITGGGGGPGAVRPGAAPLAGIRVLDLTRVIAGPLATRFLAAHGADVLRIDPPGFEEVPALLPETTLGKRCAALDLTARADRARFEALVAEAHVVVGGLRPGALDALGYGPADLRRRNPSIVTVTHDAYGWAGPWAGRRGFDSLVQMSTGIAAAGAVAAGVAHPVPLPAQALDHGTGHLLAAAACRALTRLVTTGDAADVRGSLVGAANVVLGSPIPGGLDAAAPTWTDADTEPATSAWGPLRRAPLGGTIDGHPVTWSVEPGPLGRHEPTWST
ncbi:MAG TPA: CoA transferase, partial [Aquihabitans sp.]|nr:CoA transferase [Aquihabitans sp.]